VERPSPAPNPTASSRRGAALESWDDPSFGLRSAHPRAATAGPKGDVGVVEIGQAEALLIGNHVRSLLLYLGNRPPIAAELL
jgi:hypothetical protein